MPQQSNPIKNKKHSPKSKRPKPIVGILAVLSFVFISIFIVAKLSHIKKQPHVTQVASDSKTKQKENSSNFFYKSVGGSNPDLDLSQQDQQNALKYTVHIKTVGTQQEAEGLLKDLNKSGLFGFYTPVRQQDRVLYHVRLGIYSDARDAEAVLAKIQKKYAIKASVTQLQ